MYTCIYMFRQTDSPYDIDYPRPRFGGKFVRSENKEGPEHLQSRVFEIQVTDLRVASKPWLMETCCLYHVQVDLGPSYRNPNQSSVVGIPTGGCPRAAANVPLPVLSRLLPRWVPGGGVSQTLQSWRSEPRALGGGKCTSASSKKAPICICRQLSPVCEIHSETTVGAAHCRRSGQADISITSKLPDIFQVELFASCLFPRKQYKSVYDMCGPSSVLELMKMADVTQTGGITSYYCLSFTQFWFCRLWWRYPRFKTAQGEITHYIFKDLTPLDTGLCAHLTYYSCMYPNSYI